MVRRSFSAQELVATGKRTLQSGGRLRRRQQRLRETFLIGQRQSDNFRLLDGALRGVLDGGHHEISHGAALKFSGTLEHGMQIGANSGFETGGRNGSGHGFILQMKPYGKLPYKSRRSFGACC
jgi:hypothetical protein